eukprot:359760_1
MSSCNSNQTFCLIVIISFVCGNYYIFSTSRIVPVDHSSNMFATKYNLNVGFGIKTTFKSDAVSDTISTLNNCEYQISEVVNNANTDTTINTHYNILESQNVCSNGPLTSKWKCFNKKCGKMNTRNTSNNCKYCKAEKQKQTLIEYAVHGYCMGHIETVALKKLIKTYTNLPNTQLDITFNRVEIQEILVHHVNKQHSSQAEILKLTHKDFKYISNNDIVKILHTITDRKYQKYLSFTYWFWEDETEQKTNETEQKANEINNYKSEKHRQQWQNVLNKKLNESLQRKVNEYQKQISDIKQDMINERKKLDSLFHAQKREYQREINHIMMDFKTQKELNQQLQEQILDLQSQLSTSNTFAHLTTFLSKVIDASFEIK